MKAISIFHIYCILKILFSIAVECQDMKKFDIAENWDICNKKIVIVEPDSTVKNFEETFNKNLIDLSSNGGGTLHLKKGVYIVSAPVKVPKKTCITGESLAETIVRLDKEAESFHTKGKGILSCSKSDHVSIMNVTIDGNKDQQYESHKYYTTGRYGISIERCNHSWLRNVRAVRNQKIGIYIRGSKSKLLYNSYSEGVFAERNDQDGFKARSVRNLTMTNSVIRDNKRNAISIIGQSHTVTLQDLSIDTCKYGIVIDKKDGKYPDGVEISNVDIRNAVQYGVYEKAGRNIALEKVSVINKEDRKAKCLKIKHKKNFTVKNTICEVKSGMKFDTEMGSNKCDAAIIRSNVCCPLSCEICGGSGCSNRGPKKSCCIGAIRKSENMCSKSSPPCIMD